MTGSALAVLDVAWRAVAYGNREEVQEEGVLKNCAGAEALG